MNSKELIRIFENENFTTENNKIFGKVIIMSPEKAFLFSATTGAKYLFYQNGITMKGRSEVFIHRSIFSDSHLIYSPGLFSRTIDGYIAEGNSADALLNKFPIVFKGNKKVAIVDVETGITSNIENSLFNKIKSSGESPEEYVIYKNYISNEIGESLMEYFASIHFISKGYLVENQTPWFQQNYHFEGKTLQGGIPDFSAFHSSISRLLFENNIIATNSGISLLLLPVIKLFRNNLFKVHNDLPDFHHELLIGEAKTSASSLPQAIKQLDKYNAVKIADELFTIIPNSSSNKSYGSLFIDNYKISYIQQNRKPIDDDRTKADSSWIDTYVKVLLLGNISFKKIIEIISAYRSKNGLKQLEKYEATHLLDAVQNINNNDFFEMIKENL